MDSAYQGFASGDAEADAAALRRVLDDGPSLLLAQSFAKNFGLYGERVGTLSVACADAAEKERVMSQLKLIIRPMYSSPPIHGALIVSEVLGDAALSTVLRRVRVDGGADQRDAHAAARAARGGGERARLAAHHRPDRHVRLHRMDAAMCDRLTDEHNIFLTRDGRISVAGVNSGNVDYIAAAVHDVTKGKSIGA